jgi:hypothetical protein
LMVLESLIPANSPNERSIMKQKKLHINVMTKQLADTLAKEVAIREKKAEGGIAVRRGQIKGKKEK